MTATIFLSLYFLPNWVDSILIGLKRKHPSPTSFPLKIHPTKHPKNNLLSPFLSSLSILPRIHSNQMDTYVFFCAYISFGSLFMPKKKRKKKLWTYDFFFLSSFYSFKKIQMEIPVFTTEKNSNLSSPPHHKLLMQWQRDLQN